MVAARKLPKTLAALSPHQERRQFQHFLSRFCPHVPNCPWSRSSRAVPAFSRSSRRSSAEVLEHFRQRPLPRSLNPPRLFSCFCQGAFPESRDQKEPRFSGNPSLTCLLVCPRQMASGTEKGKRTRRRRSVFEGARSSDRTTDAGTRHADIELGTPPSQSYSPTSNCE